MLFSLVAIVVIVVFREDIKALMLRVAKIKLPGGAEFSTSQSKQLDAEEEKPAPEPPVNEEVPIPELPGGAYERTKGACGADCTLVYRNCIYMGVSVPQLLLGQRCSDGPGYG